MKVHVGAGGLLNLAWHGGWVISSGEVNRVLVYLLT